MKLSPDMLKLHASYTIFKRKKRQCSQLGSKIGDYHAEDHGIFAPMMIWVYILDIKQTLPEITLNIYD